MDASRDLALPNLDAKALARRAALPAGGVAAVAVLVLVGGAPAQAFADALDRALGADPRWVLVGAIFEVLSFVGYIALLGLVGKLALRTSAQITLGGAAATRLLPTAGVGGAALTLWALKRNGSSTRDATHTLLTFLVLLYAVFLAAIAGAGATLAVTGDGPLVLTALPATLAALAILTAAWLGLRGRGRLGRAVGAAAGHLRAPHARLLGAPSWWAFDAAVLMAMFAAFGGGPPLGVIVLAYFVGQVGNTIPLPGAVSGGMVGVLLAFGVSADLALVSVLSYRAIAIWLPTPVGAIALLGLTRAQKRQPADAHEFALAAC